MSQLAIYLLGPPHVERGGEPLKIGRRKVLALLAYLAMTKQRHSRDTLATFLAPEFDQTTARTDLRRTLSLLNSLLGPGWLAADRETVGTLPDADPSADFAQQQALWLDIDHFRQCLAACQTHGHPLADACPRCIPLLEEAAALYQGDFMAGFSLPDSLPFDEWQRFESEALRQELDSALERLVRGLSAQGENDSAMPHARRWLELNLTHEPAHRALMELYARTGQTSAALHQYEYCVQTLAEGLGVPPSDETRKLYERIRSGQATESSNIAPSQAPHTAEIPHNLPTQSTPFIGREADLAELDRFIADPDVRLITIVGPGGMGKTRLAHAAAERQLDQPADSRIPESTSSRTTPFPDGVYLIPLARLIAADQIAASVAEALDFQLSGDGESRTPRQQVLAYVREKRLLLILDNLEHLIGVPGVPPPETNLKSEISTAVRETAAAVELVADILRTAAGVQILVTSRERLPLHEEQAYPLQGLECSDGDSGTATADYPAALLFLQAARRVYPGFDLDGDDVAALARLCRLVDGMPLALELAASWVDLLSLSDIFVEIQANLSFLETEWRDVPRRHRSMRAVIDTSWGQLSLDEQFTFAQLSVFRGGFTLDAARDVTESSLRGLLRLANKALVYYDHAKDRYQVHELLRQYGAEQLSSNPAATEAVRDRHCGHYAAALQRWDADLKSLRQRAATDEIQAALENIRAAWEWALSRRQFSQLSQALDALCLFYARPFRPRAGAAVCESVVDLLDPAAAPSTAEAEGLRVVVRALAWQAYFMSQGGVPSDPRLQKGLALLGDPALAGQDTRSERALVLKMMGFFGRTTMKDIAELKENQQLLDESLSLWRELGNQWQLAHTLVLMANVQTALGAFELAQEKYAEALALARELDEQWMAAYCLRGLGHLASDRGLDAQAEQLFNESLELSQLHGDPGGTNTVVRMFELALNQGDYQAATNYGRQGVDSARRSGNQHSLVIALGVLAQALVATGETLQARAALEEALALARELATTRLTVWVASRQVDFYIHTGRYLEAQAQAQGLLPIVQEMGEQYWIARIFTMLGYVALATDESEAARRHLEEGLRAYSQTSPQVWIPLLQAALGLALHRLKKPSQAQKCLIRALKAARQAGRGTEHARRALTLIAAVTADARRVASKERAIELYALGMSDPLVANSTWYDDVAGTPIAAAAASLSPEVVAAAEERGRALDWWETAEVLLDELRELGWGQ